MKYYTNIRILSDEVISKIAAGEVIERPASVVKELVENSIDAQAKHIGADFENSGKKLIRISDNGCGMTEEEAKLSIKRYSTSKMSEFSDLSEIISLGFRGEALYSIASVSKLKLITRTAETNCGCELLVENNKLKYCRETGTPAGTIIEVNDLFYNTPVRKKFLKSDSSERSRILNIIEELALSHYTTGFSVTGENKKLLTLPAVKILDERIIDIFGNEIHNGLKYFESRIDTILFKGYISKIEYSQPNKKLQYFFINSRPVASRILSQAMYSVYRDSVPVGRHPAVILFIEIDPSNIDVNVHPTKRQVKFSDDNIIYDKVCDILRKNITSQSFPVFRLPETKQDLPERKQEIPVIRDNEEKYEQNNLSVGGDIAPSAEKNILSDEMFVLGQVYDTYVIIQTPTGLVIIDQHAANERILYEKFVNTMSQGNPVQQKMLVPETIETTPHEDTVLQNLLGTINNLGFDIEHFGPNTYIIKSYPAAIGRIRQTKEFIKEFISIIIEGFDSVRTGTAEPESKIIRAACRAAVKARDKLSVQEIESLVRELKICKQPMCCPHGRPTMIHLPIEELQKKFRR